jgi:Tfp pilus assembly PilM family ATPase
MDFFEHQRDKTVTQVFVGGGSAGSEMVIQTLQAELMAECKPWNPISFLSLALTPPQAAEIEHVSYRLGVAVGAGLAAF